MARIVLTADATQMSEYWGIPLLPFFSCAPAEKVPRIVFDFLSPQVKHNNGVAQMAHYGLRKLQASILRTYKPEEVWVAHPDKVYTLADEVNRTIVIAALHPVVLRP